MASNLILVDCDDVLLDWMEGFRVFCSHVLGREVLGRPENWDMSGWIGTTAEECRRLVLDFNHGAPEFGVLPPTNHAEHVLPKLAEAGHRFVVITSCSSHAKTVSLRKSNLKNVFGDVFEAVHCLDLGVSKADLLAAYDATYWIEDNYKNAKVGVDAGHKAIVVRRPHNAEFEPADRDCLWVDDWHRIRDEISA